jgi:hypothetical protein
MALDPSSIIDQLLIYLVSKGITVKAASLDKLIKLTEELL